MDTIHMGFPNPVFSMVGPRIFIKKNKMTSRNWGVTAWYQRLGIRIPRTRFGHGLDHAFIVHLMM